MRPLRRLRLTLFLMHCQSWSSLFSFHFMNCLTFSNCRSDRWKKSWPVYNRTAFPDGPKTPASRSEGDRVRPLSSHPASTTTGVPITPPTPYCHAPMCYVLITHGVVLSLGRQS